MSLIALAMNLTLVVLLLAAMGIGIRLERRLRALKDGQASFVDAVADLDRAAQRAQAGLADLRVATDEAVDLLAGRIEKARELALKLDKMTQDAVRAPERTAPTAAPPAMPTFRPRPTPELPPERAEAAAEDLVLRLTERDLVQETARRPVEPVPTQRSRASVDDDLFEAGPRLAGGRR